MAYGDFPIRRHLYHMKFLKSILALFSHDGGADSFADFHKPAVCRISVRQFFGVFGILALAILSVTWPWVCHFNNEFIVHWDPPFHTWKLEYVAKSILAGHFLPEGGNTNMHYPNSGALFYEALHWPQAVLAAGLFCVTDNPVLVYHLVLVFFWALSGACMWLLLLELGLTRLAAVAGAFFFVVNPYRISYRVEFNMELCFALPLFFFFMVRFFKKPGIGLACGMAIALWLQAASELYQAMFVVMIFPLLFMGLIARDWKLMASGRRFWIPVSVAAMILGILTYWLLWPYSVLHSEQVVERGLREVAKHSLEPLAYFSSSMKYSLLGTLNVKHDEMCVYPTLTILLLSASYLVMAGIRHLKEDAFSVKVLRVTRLVLLAFFFVMSIVFHRFTGITGLTRAYSYTPIFVVLLSFPILFLARNPSVSGRFYDAFFAASLFAFFMTLGPSITFVNTGIRIPNVMYLDLYNHVSALNGFRVVSRFSVIILIFLSLSAAWFLDALQRRNFFRGRQSLLAVVYLSTGLLVAVSSLPRNTAFHPVEVPVSTPVIQFLDNRQTPYVLAMVPMGERRIDGMHMLQIARNTKTFVYAWGGNFPKTSDLYRQVLSPTPGSPQKALPVLSQLWPECLILIDKPSVASITPDYDIVADYAAQADKLKEDERFALFQIRPDRVPATEKIKIVRQDYLLKRPRLVFSIHAERAMSLTLLLNEKEVGRYHFASGDSSASVVILPEFTKKIVPNTFQFRGDSDYTLRSFSLEPEESESSR